MDRRLIILALFILLIPTVTAFKVGPAAQTFTLEPGSTSEYGLRIFNDGEPLSVSVSAEGPFADQVVLEPRSFTMGVAEGERRVIVRVTHPSAETLIPGRNTVKVFVSAKPDGEGQFSSAVTLNHNLNLYRQYDGTYIEGSIGVKDAPVRGGEAIFTLSLVNRGTENGSVTGTAVLTTKEVPVATVSFGTALFVPGIESKLVSRWVADVEPGRYVVDATYLYDDRGSNREETLSDSVMVGAPSVVLGGLTKTLRADTIESLNIPVTLSWNEPVEAEVVVALMRGNNVVVQTVTPATILSPGISTDFRAFLELPVLESGEYILQVMTKATNGKLLGEETFPVAVTTQLIVVPSLDEPSSFTTPLLILLVVIVLITFGLRLLKKSK